MLRELAGAASLLPVCFAGALIAGCGVGYHVSAGPYATTEADVGVQVRAGITWGLQVGEHSVLAESLEAGVGPAFSSAEGATVVLGGLDYVYLGSPVALRAGLRMGLQAHFRAGEVRPTVGGGLSLALWDGRDRHSTGSGKGGVGSLSSSGFGGQLDAFVVQTEPFGQSEGRFSRTLGYFALLATWQSFSVIDLF
jgi:hypothetical protein